MDGNQIDIEDLSIGIAHWHVNSWGGAEYLVSKLADVLGITSVYTLGSPSPNSQNPYGDVEFADVIEGLSVAPIRRLQQRFDRVFEYSLWEDVDWRRYGEFDIIITSGATTRAVITPEETLHVNYCHSPSRWLYDRYHDRKESLIGILSRPLIRHLRTRDYSVDPRVDHYLVNSPVIKRRLWKYHKRVGKVLYPPIEVESYYYESDEGFYLHLGRLDQEKGIQEVVTAFSNSERRLVVAGTIGDIADDTYRIIESSPNIDYRGFVSEEEKRYLLARCTGVIFNGVSEDFGIIPIEANASGKPVLVRDEGFPSIYVTEGENGYTHNGTSNGIIQSVETLENKGLTDDMTEYTDPFSIDAFRDNLRSSLTEMYVEFSDLN